MSVRNYVGARYVPKFAENPDWQENTAYEAMVIVLYHNSSYTSKIPVPPTVGNPAENPKYWALTGNYNAQIEEYRKSSADIQAHARDDLDKTIADLNTTKEELEDFKNTENTNNTELNNKITALRNNITINVEEGDNASKYYAEAGELIYWKGKLYKNTDVIPVNAPFVTSGSDRNIVETTISDVVYNMAQQFKNANTSTGLSFAKLNRDLTTETNNRTTKDTELENAINTETTNRTNEDAKLQSAINTEVTNRTTQYNLLKSTIDNETTNRVNEDTKLKYEINQKVNIKDFRYGDFYKKYSVPSTTTTHTTSGVSMMIARDGSDLTNFPTEQGKIFLPIMAEYTYYASKDDYDNGRAQKLDLGYYTITPYDETTYLIKYRQNENFTSWLEKLEVIGLVIKTK